MGIKGNQAMQKGRNRKEEWALREQIKNRRVKVGESLGAQSIRASRKTKKKTHSW
jgi:hypothetical protein